MTKYQQLKADLVELEAIIRAKAASNGALPEAEAAHVWDADKIHALVVKDYQPT